MSGFMTVTAEQNGQLTDERKPDVSIIIPVYNRAGKIEEAVDSILQNTFENYEILIVDDGSTDNTLQVCRRLEEQDKRIHVLTQVNCGAAAARNNGILHAKGEYIMFLDSDDRYLPEMIRNLYNSITTLHTDIAFCAVRKIQDERDKERDVMDFRTDRAYSCDEYLNVLLSHNNNLVGVWNKIYRSDLLRRHPMYVTAYEDVAWIPYIFSYAGTFSYVREPGYEWDVRKPAVKSLSGELAGRDAAQRYKDRMEAIRFFVEMGNQDKRQLLLEIGIRKCQLCMLNKANESQKENYGLSISSMRKQQHLL